MLKNLTKMLKKKIIYLAAPGPSWGTGDHLVAARMRDLVP